MGAQRLCAGRVGHLSGGTRGAPPWARLPPSRCLGAITADRPLSPRHGGRCPQASPAAAVCQAALTSGRPSRLQYKVLLYSLDGRLLAAYCAYEWSLGIKSVAWSPSSQFLAVGSYDGKVRILNHVTWKMLTEFGHPAAVGDPRVVRGRPSV